MINNFGSRDESERRESDIWNRLEDLESQVKTVQQQLDEPPSAITPAINNFVRNGDGNYTQGGWDPTATFTNKEKVAGVWYTIQSGTTTQLTEHTASAESSQSLMDASHPSYSNPACDWDKAGGVFRLGGGYSLVHPMTKNILLPGFRIFVQAIMKLAAGVSVTGTHQIQASLFENLGSGSRRIIEATAWDPVLAAVGGTGSTTRKYAVEIITTNGVSRSNTKDITNSVATLSPTQYVSINWQAHLGIIKINIYRSTDGGSTWKKITGSGLTGGTSFYDTGITGVSASLPSASNQKAFARVLVSEALTTEWQRVMFSVPVPPYYVMPTATDKQVLEINVVDSTGAVVSTTNRGILVDKVGVSYNNGIWTPSPEDLVTAATVQSTNPDPGAGGPPPPGGDPGDGDGLCITLDQPVLMADGTTKPAEKVVAGDWVKVLYEGRLEDAQVSHSLRGLSHNILDVQTDKGSIKNNPPHRLITKDNELGEAAISLHKGSKIIVAGYVDNQEVVSEATVTSLSMQSSEEPIPVAIFRIKHPAKNFISGFLNGGVGGPVSHNRKII